MIPSAMPPHDQAARYMKRMILALAAFGVFSPDVAEGQSSAARFDAGVQIAALSSSQFDAADVGFGGRLSWHPVELAGMEAELNLYPGDFPGSRPFSRGRVEALFGMTVAAPLGRVRPFARLRSGFVTLREAPEPFPCIAIFPPPLACALAAGQTLAAFDLGGGLEVVVTPRGFVRVDVGDRMIRYRGPVFDRRQQVRDDTFYGHDIRVAVGAGFRF
jgi:hypothetical protein